HKIKQRLHFIDEIAETIRTRDTLFLLLGGESTERLEAELARLTHGGSSKPAVAADVRLVPANGSSVFQLPMHTHQVVIDVLVDWLSGVFDRSQQGSPESDEAALSQTAG
ncbi:MAG: hypothetical protein ACRDJ2_16285, partial [Actinomycetota bacterium]